MQKPCLEVYLGPLKLDKLGHPETVPIREEEQRRVPVPVASDLSDCGDKLLHLGRRQVFPGASGAVRLTAGWARDYIFSWRTATSFTSVG